MGATQSPTPRYASWSSITTSRQTALNLASPRPDRAFAPRAGQRFFHAAAGERPPWDDRARRPRPSRGALGRPADPTRTCTAPRGGWAVAVLVGRRGYLGLRLFWWEVSRTRPRRVHRTLPRGGYRQDVGALLASLTPTRRWALRVDSEGDGVEALPMTTGYDRDMTTEWGAIGRRPFRIVPCARMRGAFRTGDDRNSICPRSLPLRRPDSLTHADPVCVISRKRIAIQKAYLVSCATSDSPDLAAAGRRASMARWLPRFRCTSPPRAPVLEAAEQPRPGRRSSTPAPDRFPPGADPVHLLGPGLLAAGDRISASIGTSGGAWAQPDAALLLAVPLVAPLRGCAGSSAAPTAAGRAFRIGSSRGHAVAVDVA